MSDDPNAQQPGESDHEYMQRMNSPQLRMLDMLNRTMAVVEGLTEATEKLTQRVKTGEAETKAKFDFILDQQAQLVASVGQLAATVDKLSDKVDRTAGSITNLLAAAEIQAGEISDLTQAVRAVDERQRHTDERLNVLINTVERFISEGRNGKS
jgi:uncharacterized protein YoxC